MSVPFLRALAVALLALSLPLQGVASVVSAQCMAFEHHDAGMHDHGQGHDESVDAHDHAAPAHPDDGKSAHCGPCTACCASASIAGPAALCVVLSLSDTEYVFSQLAPSGVELHRFDRPPLGL